MKKIFLSPSTQEKNVEGDYNEETYCNSLTDDIFNTLSGVYEVSVKRNNPNSDLVGVVADSNAFDPDFHLAIHTNADSGLARGCEVFVHTKESRGMLLAEAIYKRLESITPTKDRGIKVGKDYYGVGKSIYELKVTNSPACLVEIAFHDNEEDQKWLIDNKKAIAQMIVGAVAEVMQLKKREKTVEHIVRGVYGNSKAYTNFMKLLEKTPNLKAAVLAIYKYGKGDA